MKNTSMFRRSKKLFWMNFVVCFMLLLTGVGAVSALTITEDYTVLENQIINEDLTLDGASHCTISNNTIHGQLRLLNEANYNNISGNTVDNKIFQQKTYRNTLTGNRMGGYNSVGPDSSHQDKHYFNHTIDTTNLVNGEPLYYYFDKHDFVIENISDFGQLVVAEGRNVTAWSEPLLVYNKLSNFCI
jgi:hypothetical protein